jgi:2-polyprenyl-6-methoxyphenol hydroxylase-like FAD-dependent oxidoreductase
MEDKQTTFKSLADGSCSTVPYDFLIGADGANSRWVPRSLMPWTNLAALVCS